MKVVKNFLYNVSYQLLVILLPLITVPYVSKILGATGVGDYAFTFANCQYFVIFGMIGITLYGNRQIAYVRDNKKELKRTFYSIYTLQFIATLISLVTYLVFFYILNDSKYKILYLVQALNIIAAMVDISWLFMGLEEFKKTVIRNTIVKVISLASIFIFVKSKDDILVYAAILGISSAAGNLTFWVYLPKLFIKEKVKVEQLKLHFKAAISLFIPQISIQIYLLLDRTLLGIITDSVQVGYYENSQKIVKMILTIVTAIGTVMMPKIANTLALGNYDKVKYYIKNSFFFMTALALPMTIGLMAISSKMSPWFFGKEFLGIENLIQVSSLIIIAIGWSNVLGTQLLIPMNKTKEFTISVTSGAVLNLVLNLIILKYLGAVGACISTVIAESVVTVVQFYFVKSCISPKELLKPVTIFIIPSIIMFLAVIFIGSFMNASIITTIVQALVGVITYVIICDIISRLKYKQNILNYMKKIIKT